MPLMSKNDLYQLLPHRGAMCLLDSVLHWDTRTISCTASSHYDRSNPLRRPEGLETICGLEYAAQAMGVHIGLTTSSNRGTAIGYVGAIKTAKLHVPYLDVFKSNLEIYSEQQFFQETSFIYTFVMRAESRKLLEGRVSIFVKYIVHY